MRKNLGFTLIELLVTIAIIGLLSSIVLAALTNARKKAQDANIKEQLAQVRRAADIYYSTNETYGRTNGFAGLGSAELCSDVAAMSGTVFADSSLAGLLNPTGFAFGQLYCSSDVNKFAVAAMLSNGSPWCVDTNGYAGLIGDGSVLVSLCN